ncbi:MAG: hypothetical protein CSA23_02315 [Deltaproteobacteria bacterium]|nr:MAG: hypothetical protein CSA23_02315 [Deltaproteobacteria bacterium]
MESHHNFQKIQKGATHEKLIERFSGLVKGSITPSVAKAGGRQRQNARGEAAASYCDPLATQDLAKAGNPQPMSPHFLVFLTETEV